MTDLHMFQLCGLAALVLAARSPHSDVRHVSRYLVAAVLVMSLACWDEW